MIPQSIAFAKDSPQNAEMHKHGIQRDPRDIICDLQAQHGIGSVRQLALKAGIQQPSLSRYLKGQSKTMELESFQALAAVFDVTLSELLGETPRASNLVREVLRLLANMNEPTQEQWLRVGKALIDK